MPHEGEHRIPHPTLAFEKERAKTILRQRNTGTRGGEIMFGGEGYIPRHRIAGLINVGEIELGRSVTLCDGLLRPIERTLWGYMTPSRRWASALPASASGRISSRAVA